MEIGFTGVPGPVVAHVLADMSQWRVIGQRMLERTKQNCPIGKVKELGASYNQEHGGQHLRDSMQVRYEYGPDPRILIGSELTRGEGNVSALGLIEMGTEAHEILPRNPDGVLRFTWYGETVYFRKVDHPGTKENKFVERSIRSVIMETVRI